MNYNTIKYFSTTNGEGIRTAIFVSGCSLHCKGCFNKEAWDFEYGKELTTDVINRVLDSIDYDYIDGLSILGGEPMDERNIEGVLHIVESFRKRYGNTKDIWIWSGYTIDTLNTETHKKILDGIDVLVDGGFVESKYSNGLKFRGSSNQRILRKVDNLWVESVE